MDVCDDTVQKGKKNSGSGPSSDIPDLSLSRGGRKELFGSLAKWERERKGKTFPELGNNGT